MSLERALAALPMANLALSERVQQGIFALRADLTDAKFQMVAMQEALVTEMRKQARHSNCLSVSIQNASVAERLVDNVTA